MNRLPMKKIFTLCVGLMIALSSWAQGFEFQYQGESLPNDETVIIAAEEDWFGDLTCETNSTMDPSADGLVLKLLRGTTASATAILQITYNSLDADVLQWCMGGNCQALQTSLTKQFTMGNSEKVQFDAIGIHSEGYLTATLKVTIGLETRQVNIVFVNGDYTGLQTLPQKGSEKGATYDLLGRKIQYRTSSDIYIVKNGKHIQKIAIR